MNRHWLTAGVAATALFAGLSACGSDEKPQATPSASPVVTTSTPSATPTGQPAGPDGATAKILNWDAYASDPGVLAWVKANEGLAASINTGKLVPAVTDGMSKKVLRQFTPGIQRGWKNNWTVPNVTIAKVKSARTTMSSSKLVMCAWGESIAFYDQNQQPVVKADKTWRKQVATVKLQGNRWYISSVKIGGSCTGSSPT